jgi:hypothetical protein
MIPFGGESKRFSRNSTAAPDISYQPPREKDMALPIQMDHSPMEETNAQQQASRSQQLCNSASSTDKQNADRNGILRYFTVVDKKRKRNHASSITNNQNSNIITKNQFDPLTMVPDDLTNKPKPPPIFIRERSTGSVANAFKSLLKYDYYLVDLKKGALFETKLQTSDSIDYTEATKWLDAHNKQYYSFQAKSAKGLRVVIKGIDHNVNPAEIKEYLESQNYKVNWVHNIINKYRIPQPMFKVELAPESSIAPKGKTHPIYDLQYVLHRRVTIDEPYKRSGPVQCTKCQEFGHTKAYCKLAVVCVGCGANHRNEDCPNDKANAMLKRCSNCGGNHTANYKGCIVFKEISKQTKQKSVPTPSNSRVPTINAGSVPVQTQPLNRDYSTPRYASYAQATAQPINTHAPADNQNQIMMMILNTIQQLTTSMQQMQELQKQQMEILSKLVKP